MIRGKWLDDSNLWYNLGMLGSQATQVNIRNLTLEHQQSSKEAVVLFWHNGALLSFLHCLL